ncbi:MAG: hypothetical protein U0411_07315 [Thermodesulfovibrionales bacterium]
MKPKSMTRGMIAVVLTVVLVSLGLSFGQTTKGTGSKQRMYNPATVETVTGTVESVEKVPSGKGGRYGIHLTLKTDKETIPIDLGPGWYIEKLDTKIEKGDTVEVKGSRVTQGGKPAIVAAEVKKGGTVISLRDEQGVPKWSRRR